MEREDVATHVSLLEVSTMSCRTLPRRKVHRRYNCGRRTKRRLPRPTLRKKRRYGAAKQQISAEPHIHGESKRPAPTIAEALFIAQRLLDSDGDGYSKAVAYFETLFDNYPIVYGRLLCRALNEEAAEERGAAEVDE